MVSKKLQLARKIKKKETIHARAVSVEVGDKVEPGDRLGRQGNTGLFEDDDKTRSHVHIEVREGETGKTVRVLTVYVIIYIKILYPISLNG